MKRAKAVNVTTQFKVCPVCGHTEGFHVMFSSNPRKENRLRMCLICPMCAEVYDVGATIRTKRLNVKEEKI